MVIECENGSCRKCIAEKSKQQERESRRLLQEEKHNQIQVELGTKTKDDNTKDHHIILQNK